MFRLIKRTDLPRGYSAILRLIAVLLSLLAASVFIAILGHNPIEVYMSMIAGAFGTLYRFKETIIKAIPLVVTSLGIMVAFKMKFWNIGGEGQIMMGAFAASLVALNLPGLSPFLLLPMMFIAGFLAGGLWAFIPAVFKSRFGTNETLVTLMMNYIALKWVTYLQYGPWKDPAAIGFPKIPNFSKNAILPGVLGIHAGWIIALVLVVIIHIFLSRSKKGFEVAVIGESEKTARYAGMDVASVIVAAIFISGGLCGIAGVMQASAVDNTLSVAVSGGIGYTAIITTWLSGLSAPLVIVVSFLFAVMLQGSSYIQSAFNIPESVAQILEGMILFFVLGSEFFVQYKVVLYRPDSGKQKSGGGLK